MKLPDKVTIDSLGNRVGGIARPADCPAVFVRGALPGETVTISPAAVRKNYIEADIVSIDRSSPDRREPFCPHYAKCGGCSLQHLDYSAQLHWKRIWVQKAIKGLEPPEVQQTLPSPNQTGYRNKVTFDVENGRLCLHGFRSDPVPVDSCPLMNPGAADTLRRVIAAGLPPGLRRISIRASEFTDSSSVELIGSQGGLTEIQHSSVFEEVRGEWKCLSGRVMHENLAGIVFPVPPGGFFQVNTRAAELLINTVLRMVSKDSRSILDLYGGVGTFGVPLARMGFSVESVELNQYASQACREAAALNDLKHGDLAVFNMSDASFLADAAKRGKVFDTVIVDPPRSGMGVKVTAQMKHLAPSRIIYISCNPFSASRDIAVLIGGGYRLTKVLPVDMFPHTDHVEAVFLLEGR